MHGSQAARRSHPGVRLRRPASLAGRAHVGKAWSKLQEKHIDLFGRRSYRPAPFAPETIRLRVIVISPPISTIPNLLTGLYLCAEVACGPATA